MKRAIRRVVFPLAIIGIIWVALTLWVESERSDNIQIHGKGNYKVLILYNPDPIYNFDQQVCEVFANELAGDTIEVTLATVSAMRNKKPSSYNSYVLCTNTYNWRPDKPMSRFVRQTNFAGKPVVAITLGAGSTHSSKWHFEMLLRRSGANLIDSKTFWLLRPNDESRMEESNVDVALDITREWAKQIRVKFRHV
jgi:hypothetical protein